LRVSRSTPANLAIHRLPAVEQIHTYCDPDDEKSPLLPPPDLLLLDITIVPPTDDYPLLYAHPLLLSRYW